MGDELDLDLGGDDEAEEKYCMMKTINHWICFSIGFFHWSFRISDILSRDYTIFVCCIYIIRSWDESDLPGMRTAMSRGRCPKKLASTSTLDLGMKKMGFVVQHHQNLQNLEQNLLC